jgi:hypothetical protein
MQLRNSSQHEVTRDAQAHHSDGNGRHRGDRRCLVDRHGRQTEIYRESRRGIGAVMVKHGKPLRAESWDAF